MFVAKDKPPYTDAQESSVYLNPLARVDFDKKSESLTFNQRKMNQAKYANTTGHTEDVLKALTSQAGAGSNNVGVDVELLESVNIDNETFVERNFTDAEVAYCNGSSDAQASFTGTWSAKEAVFKSLNSAGKGAGASLKEIEILRNNKGAFTTLFSTVTPRRPPPLRVSRLSRSPFPTTTSRPSLLPLLRNKLN